jgi:hypothetical protein
MSSRKTISLICDQCKSYYNKDAREYRRQIRNGVTNQFCSRSCAATHRNLTLDLGNRMKKNLLIGNAMRDEYTDFRYYVRKARARDSKMDLDLPYIKDLWEKQGGRCAFTGIPLVQWDVKNGKKNTINLGSLDRIDSSKGYLKGNVQFISAALNMAKQDMDDITFRNGLKELFESYSAHQNLSYAPANPESG